MRKSPDPGRLPLRWENKPTTRRLRDPGHGGLGPRRGERGRAMMALALREAARAAALEQLLRVASGRTDLEER